MYRIGDIVRIVKKYPGNADMSWVSGMDELIGRTGYIFLLYEQRSAKIAIPGIPNIYTFAIQSIEIETHEQRIQSITDFYGDNRTVGDINV